MRKWISNWSLYSYAWRHLGNNWQLSQKHPAKIHRFPHPCEANYLDGGVKNHVYFYLQAEISRMTWRRSGTRIRFEALRQLRHYSTPCPAENSYSAESLLANRGPRNISAPCYLSLRPSLSQKRSLTIYHMKKKSIKANVREFYLTPVGTWVWAYGWRQ